MAGSTRVAETPEIADPLIGQRRHGTVHRILRRHLRADGLEILGRCSRLRMAGGQPNVHLLHLIDKGLFQVKTLAQRLRLHGPQRLEDPDVAGFNDDPQPAEGHHKNNDNEDDRNRAFKNRIHGK